MAEPKLSPRRREVLEMTRAGKTPRQIAEAMGISIKTVHSHRERIGALGVDLPAARQQAAPLDQYSATRPPYGHVGPSVQALPPEVQSWIASNIPEGSSVAEFAIACVVDQYYDEVDA